MMEKIFYAIAFTIGWAIFYGLNFYNIANGYSDFKSNENIIDNITLLFALFTWRKVFQTHEIAKELFKPFIRKE